MGIETGVKQAILGFRMFKDAILYEIPSNADQEYFDITQLWNIAKNKPTVGEYYHVFRRCAYEAFDRGAKDVVFFVDNYDHVPTLKTGEQVARRDREAKRLVSLYESNGTPISRAEDIVDLRLSRNMDEPLHRDWMYALSTQPHVRQQMFADVAHDLLTSVDIPDYGALIVYGIRSYSPVPLAVFGNDSSRTKHRLPSFADDVGESELRVVYWMSKTRHLWRSRTSSFRPFSAPMPDHDNSTTFVHSIDGDMLPILLSSSHLRGFQKDGKWVWKDRVIWIARVGKRLDVVDINKLYFLMEKWFGIHDPSSAHARILSLCYLMFLCGSDYVNKPFMQIGAGYVIDDWLQHGHILRPLFTLPRRSLDQFAFGDDICLYAPILDLEACWNFVSLLYVVKNLGKKRMERITDMKRYVLDASRVPYDTLADEKLKIYKPWTDASVKLLCQSMAVRPVASSIHAGLLQAYWAFLYYMVYGICGRTGIKALDPTHFGWEYDEQTQKYRPLRDVDPPLHLVNNSETLQRTHRSPSVPKLSLSSSSSSITSFTTSSTTSFTTSSTTSSTISSSFTMSTSSMPSTPERSHSSPSLPPPAPKKIHTKRARYEDIEQVAVYNEDDDESHEDGEYSYEDGECRDEDECQDENEECIKQDKHTKSSRPRKMPHAPLGIANSGQWLNARNGSR